MAPYVDSSTGRYEPKRAPLQTDSISTQSSQTPSNKATDREVSTPTRPSKRRVESTLPPMMLPANKKPRCEPVDDLHQEDEHQIQNCYVGKSDLHCKVCRHHSVSLCLWSVCVHITIDVGFD